MVRWIAPSYRENETYRGTARVLKVEEGRTPLKVDVIEGDDLGYAFFSDYDDELCLSDAGRYVEFCIVDEDWIGLTDRQIIGKRIAAIRNELGLSQQDVADRVGMRQPHIARIEAGRYSVGIDILGKIAAALGKRVDLVD